MKRKQRIYRPEQPVKVEFIDDSIIVTLADGRVLRQPLPDFPWLNQASPEQRIHYELDPFSIYWPDWDDGIDIDWMIDRQSTLQQASMSRPVPSQNH